jgi:hypothetical protein
MRKEVDAMFNAEDRMPQATDVSLLNQLVMEVYLAAWTMAGVKHEQTLRRVAASSDDVDDGETALDVVDLDRFIRPTRGLDFGVPEAEIAERSRSSMSRRRARRDVRHHRPCTSTERNGRTCPSASPRSERFGSVCYTRGQYLMDQSANYWRGGSGDAF